jgi:mycofactocin precursor
MALDANGAQAASERMSPMDENTAGTETVEVDAESLVEEVSIDGMCGVY